MLRRSNTDESDTGHFLSPQTYTININGSHGEPFIFWGNQMLEPFDYAQDRLVKD